MKRRGFLSLLLAVAILVALLFWVGVLPLRAQSEQDILQKLNQIISNQNKFFGEFEELKLEIRKIKYRANM